MFPRLRSAARRMLAAVSVEGMSPRIRSAITPLTDDAADSQNPLKWGDNWRTAAMHYPPLLRCVSMVASECARLTSTTISVVTQDGMAVESDRDARNARVMRESVDGGISPAADFWLDAFSDLMVEGNALIIPKMRDGVISSLRLMRARTARYERASDGYIGKVLGEGDREVRVPRSWMVHARMYGSALSDGGLGRQWPFSDSPIRLLGGALGLSERVEEWIRRELIGAKGHLVISPKTGRLGKSQQEQMTEQVGAFLRSRRPLVSGGPVDVESFGASAREAAITDIRDYQLREIARVFGIPLPLIGSPVSAWGSGIEALAREYWKRAIAPRMHDMLAPLSHRLCGPEKVLTVDPLELIRGDSNDIVRLLSVLRPNTKIPPIALVEEMRRLASLPKLTLEMERELKDQAGWMTGADAEAEAAAAAAGEEEEEPAGEDDGGLDTREARSGRMSLAEDLEALADR